MTERPNPLLIANTIDEALDAVSRGSTPIAGGTDLVVGARQGNKRLPASLVAIDRVEELQSIGLDSDGSLSIGSGVTHATLMSSTVVVTNYTALADAAALIGSPATRNVGTIGGNVMNGSPAMDTGAPLAVFDAMIQLSTVAGNRQITTSELWVAPGQTSAEPDELCTAIIIAPQPDRSGSAYVRLEYRRSMEIAVVGAAAVVTLGLDGTIAGCRIALTAVAPTIVLVDGLESLIGQAIGEATLATVADLASSQAAPISDLRASEQYRSHSVGVMAKRAVLAAARRATGESISVPVNRSIGVGSDGQRQWEAGAS